MLSYVYDLKKWYEALPILKIISLQHTKPFTKKLYGTSDINGAFLSKVIINQVLLKSYNIRYQKENLWMYGIHIVVLKCLERFRETHLTIRLRLPSERGFG